MIGETYDYGFTIPERDPWQDEGDGG